LTFMWILRIDAVGLLYAVKIVARFYTVQYEHMKRDVVACSALSFFYIQCITTDYVINIQAQSTVRLKMLTPFVILLKSLFS